MIIELAKNYGFCFGVKRAIKKAEQIKDAATIGPLIHNNENFSFAKKILMSKLWKIYKL